MAEDSKSQIGVSLLLDKPELSADPKKCIICQKPGSKNNSLQSGETGRKRVRETAETKDDIVHKRLRVLVVEVV